MRLSLVIVVVVLGAACGEMHRPRGGHFVAHGFYQQRGTYRVRALSQSPRTTLVPERWQLVGFAGVEDGVPGVRHRDEEYDFRYRHARLGEMWARSSTGSPGPVFPDYLTGSPVVLCSFARVPVAVHAHRLLSYGPARVDGERAWMATLDVWRQTDSGGEEARVTLAVVRPGWDTSTSRRGRRAPLVFFGYLSPIEEHGEGLMHFESMLRRVDFQ